MGRKFHTESILESLLERGNIESAIILIKAMKDEGLCEIRSHYFWPIISHYVTNQNMEALCNIIKVMEVNF